LIWKIIFLLLPISVFSFELSCPYGECDQLEDNINYTQLAKKLYQILKKTGLELDCDILIGAESYADWEKKPPVYLAKSYDFDRECDQSVLGERCYWAQHTLRWGFCDGPQFEVSFGQYDSVVPYFERTFATNYSSEPQTTTFLVASFHESARILSQLRNDHSLYMNGEIAYLQLKISDLKRDLIEMGKRERWENGFCYVLPIEKYKSEYDVYIARYLKRIDMLQTRFSKAEKFIDNAESQINSFFRRLYHYCMEEHQNTRGLYELSLMDFAEGNNLDAFFQLRKLINEIELEGNIQELSAELHLLDGLLCNELSQFHEAISALTQCIQKNPNNKEAYYERALAYFETGQLEASLQDYLQSEIKPTPSDLSLIESIDFSLGLTKGAARGGIDGLSEFIPSMLSSLEGLGHGLWAFALDPIQVSKDLINGAQTCINYLREHSSKEIVLDLVPELQNLVHNWDALSSLERGEMTGYVIGKYGVDIFAAAGSAKAMKAYRELKRANGLFTLETAAQSQRNSAEIAVQAHKRADARQKVFQPANLKIQADKQGKHIVGHRNFDVSYSKSILEHPDPQRLVHQNAGTGLKVNSHAPGAPGYQEIVDFKEFIGYEVDPNSLTKIPTTWGKIHYAKDGVHIVPTKPRGGHGS
jgi:tetratricopeptide (TPR) repeat protein